MLSRQILIADAHTRDHPVDYPADSYRLLVEAAPHAMVLLDAARRILLVNRQTERLFGYDREDLLGQPAGILLPEFTVDSKPAPFGLRSDGVHLPIDIALSPIETGDGACLLVSIVDAAEHQRALDDKAMMLKELNHRVKNNLQVICSLLSMQIACSEDSAALAPLNDAYSRALSMALIHEQLYLSEIIGDLDFGRYIDVLSQRLFSTYCVDRARVQLELSVEPVRLDLQRAMPCGLILSELISNALKHAFPSLLMAGACVGIVRITLMRTEDGKTELTVSDNGIGLPAELNWETSPSLGMQVIRTLNRQLRATLCVTTGNTPGDNGTSFRVSWD